MIPTQIAAAQIEILPIEVRHLAQLRELPFCHRDLFGRLIVLQAITDEMSAVTRDATSALHDVEAPGNGP